MASNDPLAHARAHRPIYGACGLHTEGPLALLAFCGERGALCDEQVHHALVHRLGRELRARLGHRRHRVWTAPVAAGIRTLSSLSWPRRTPRRSASGVPPGLEYGGSYLTALTCRRRDPPLTSSLPISAQVVLADPLTPDRKAGGSHPCAITLGTCLQIGRVGFGFGFGLGLGLGLGSGELG